VRALGSAADGTLWLASERAVFRRATSGAWEEIPLPRRALGGEGAWEIASLASDERGDVWIVARRGPAGSARDVLLRTRPAAAITRWE
jgi:streptogramin lyase